MNAPTTDALPGDLLAREAALRAGGATPRLRDAAAALGVPEAALIDARRATGDAIRLAPRDPEAFTALLARLPAAGPLMALTRNEACVHEKTGTYSPPEVQGAMGQTLGEIDLRLFLGHWRHAYALTETTASGPRQSLQIFDAAGVAVHKVYPVEGTDRTAFAAILAEAADPAPEAPMFTSPPAPAPDRPDAEIDTGALRTDWAALQHSHDFFGLLRRHGVGRLQALRLAGPDFARPVPASAVEALLTGVAAAALPVMIFVGNPGCLQIHTGPVARIERMGPWLNVLDPGFNLHLRTDRIAAAYVVRKPSLRGDVHALELYDGAGGVIAQIFGARPPGAPERTDWRAVITGLASG